MRVLSEVQRSGRGSSFGNGVEVGGVKLCGVVAWRGLAP